jgi:hypothetical protein
LLLVDIELGDERAGKTGDRFTVRAALFSQALGFQAGGEEERQ